MIEASRLSAIATTTRSAGSRCVHSNFTLSTQVFSSTGMMRIALDCLVLLYIYRDLIPKSSFLFLILMAIFHIEIEEIAPLFSCSIWSQACFAATESFEGSKLHQINAQVSKTIFTILPTRPLSAQLGLQGIAPCHAYLQTTPLSIAS